MEYFIRFESGPIAPELRRSVMAHSQAMEPRAERFDSADVTSLNDLPCALAPLPHLCHANRNRRVAFLCAFKQAHAKKSVEFKIGQSDGLHPAGQVHGGIGRFCLVGEHWIFLEYVGAENNA